MNTQELIEWLRSEQHSGGSNWNAKIRQAADELERLSAPEPPKSQRRTWWIVIDDDGCTQYACDWREGAHEHINDALMEGDEEAKGWKVVTAYSDSVPAPAYRER